MRWPRVMSRPSVAPAWKQYPPEWRCRPTPLLGWSSQVERRPGRSSPHLAIQVSNSGHLSVLVSCCSLARGCGESVKRSGQGTACRGGNDLRAARCETMGGSGKRRAQGHWPESHSGRHPRHLGVDASRVGDRIPCCRGDDQQANRRSPLLVASDGRGASLPGVPKAGYHFTRRTSRRAGQFVRACPLKVVAVFKQVARRLTMLRVGVTREVSK